MNISTHTLYSFFSFFLFVLHRYEREKDNLLGEEMADEEIRDVLSGLVSFLV
jgi:hypothetical protein